MNLCEENIEEASAEEVVLQDLQRATEMVSVVILIFYLQSCLRFDPSCNRLTIF